MFELDHQRTGLVEAWNHFGRSTHRITLVRSEHGLEASGISVPSPDRLEEPAVQFLEFLTSFRARGRLLVLEKPVGHRHL